jgi:hypothetical protein
MPTIIECPHCKQVCEIVELNCRIFRCGILKTTYVQIDPHSSKAVCDDLVSKKLIYGCGKPFRITDDASQNVVICEYI